MMKTPTVFETIFDIRKAASLGSCYQVVQGYMNSGFPESEVKSPFRPEVMIAVHISISRVEWGFEIHLHGWEDSRYLLKGLAWDVRPFVAAVEEHCECLLVERG